MEHESARVGEIFNFGMLHLEWPTALFILVVFVLTMVVLNALLFKPILRTLEGRQSVIDKNNRETKEVSSSLEKSEQAYREQLSDVREKIQHARQQALNEALDEAKRIVDKTRESIGKKLEKAESELVEDRKTALKDAAALTEELSRIITSKVLA